MEAIVDPNKNYHHSVMGTGQSAYIVIVREQEAGRVTEIEIVYEPKG